MEALERVLGPEHPDTLLGASNLAYYLQEAGEAEEAESLCRRVLEARERVLGHEHPATLTSMNNLAGLLRRKGDYADAEPLCRRAFEARERLLGPDHPATLASVCSLAWLLRCKGDLAGAESLYRRAMDARQRILGPEHPLTLAVMNSLAVVLQATHRYNAAEPLYRRTLTAKERVLGPNHPSTMLTMGNLASLLDKIGQVGEAVEFRRRALDARASVAGAEANADLALDFIKLAREFRKLDRLGEAEALLRRSLAIYERINGATHPIVRHRLINLSIIVIMQGHLDEAKALLARAWQMKSEQYDITSVRLLFVRLSVALLESQRIAEYVGQLKMLLALETLSDYANAGKAWNIDYFIVFLRRRLPPDSVGMLAALAAGLNERKVLHKLEECKDSTDHPSIGLDTPWSA